MYIELCTALRTNYNTTSCTHIDINNIKSNIWSIGMHVNDNGYILHTRYKNKTNERKNKNKIKNNN